MAPFARNARPGLQRMPPRAFDDLPWAVSDDGDEGLAITGQSGWDVALVLVDESDDVGAVADLLAGAYDRALVLRALVAGIARWQPRADAPTGLLMFCAEDHVVYQQACELDSFGCPQIGAGCRRALRRALAKAGK